MPAASRVGVEIVTPDENRHCMSAATIRNLSASHFSWYALPPFEKKTVPNYLVLGAQA